MAKEPKYLKIHVIEKGKEVLNIAIPLALANLITEFVPKKELEKHNIDILRIMALITSIPEGKLIDIKDPKKKAHIEVTLE